MFNHEIFQLLGKDDPFISVVGPTGSGKSNLIQSLSKWLNLPYGDETPFTDNPFHNEYYEALKGGEKPNKYALASQLFFLITALRQASSIEEQLEEGGYIWGNDPRHHLMYPWVLYKDGKLLEEEYQTYCKIFIQGFPLLPLPDLAILTCRKTGKDTCAAIKKRAEETPEGPEKERREAEVGVPPEEWEKQIKYWKKRKKKEQLIPNKIRNQLEISFPKIPIVKLNPNKINWLTEDVYGNKINNPEGKKQVLSRLAVALKSVKSA